MAYEMGTWDYSHLFEDGTKEHLDEYVNKIIEDIDNFSSYREKLDQITTHDFVNMMELSETITSKEHRLFRYLSLRKSVNSNDYEAADLSSKYTTLLIEAGNNMVFFSLWFQNLDEEKAQEFIKAVPEHAYNLHLLRKNKPHTLSEKEEQLSNAYSQFSASATAEMRTLLVSDFTFDFDEEHMGITREELESFRYSSHKEKRHRSYILQHEKHKHYAKVLHKAYKNASLQWDVIGMKYRKYPSPLARNTFDDDIDEKSIQILLDACKKHTYLVQRHMRLKARALGEQKLHRHDLYAPVGKDSDKKFSYDEAVKMTLETYKNFDDEMANFAQQVFDKGFVDAPPKKGKRSGAFCSYSNPDVLPYIMLNFTGTLTDVSTMVHEMGHGIHHCLASKELNIFNNHSVIPLAETASTFGETAFLEHYLKHANEEERFVLCDEMLKDFYATVFRQAFFVLFEKEVHEAFREGKTMDEVTDIYLDSLKQQFGDDVVLPDDFRYEYLTIPHIVESPFYCAGYAFGKIFSVKMYQGYKNEGKDFIPRIKKVMELGGSMKPADIVATAGFDMDKEEFWDAGFTFYEGLLDQFEQMLTKRNL